MELGEVHEYDRDDERSLPAAVPICVNVVPSVERSTLKLVALLEFTVQVRSISLLETAFAVRLLGAAGGFADCVSGSGVVILYKDEKKALVVGDGLRPLDARANTYQLWAIDSGGTPKSIGLMQAGADGHVLAVVPFDPDAAGTLAVTIEPAGGSGQPTSAPIFTAEV